MWQFRNIVWGADDKCTWNFSLQNSINLTGMKCCRWQSSNEKLRWNEWNARAKKWTWTSGNTAPCVTCTSLATLLCIAKMIVIRYCCLYNCIVTLSAAINYCVETLLEVFLTLVAIFLWSKHLWNGLLCLFCKIAFENTRLAKFVPGESVVVLRGCLSVSDITTTQYRALKCFVADVWKLETTDED